MNLTPSPTVSEAVASENCGQWSAYHKPLSNYLHCSGFWMMYSQELPLCHFIHSLPPNQSNTTHSASSLWGSPCGQWLQKLGRLSGSPPEPLCLRCFASVCSLESDIACSAPALWWAWCWAPQNTKRPHRTPGLRGSQSRGKIILSPTDKNHSVGQQHG